jgi:hypothetical protein
MARGHAQHHGRERVLRQHGLRHLAQHVSRRSVELEPRAAEREHGQREQTREQDQRGEGQPAQHEEWEVGRNRGLGAMMARRPAAFREGLLMHINANENCSYLQ